MKKQNSWLCQIKAWAVLKFSFNKPTQIHLMFLYKEYYCIEKAFFLHHIHWCFSVCLLSQRLSPSWLHPKQGGQQVRERILPLHSAPALGAPAQESHGPVRASLGEHHKHNHRVGAALQWKLPEITGLFHPGERKLQRDLTEPFSTYRRLTGESKRIFYTGRQ